MSFTRRVDAQRLNSFEKHNLIQVGKLSRGHDTILGVADKDFTLAIDNHKTRNARDALFLGQVVNDGTVKGHSQPRHGLVLSEEFVFLHIARHKDNVDIGRNTLSIGKQRRKLFAGAAPTRAKLKCSLLFL